MLQRGTSLIRQPECSRLLSAAPRSGDTPTQAGGGGGASGEGRGAQLQLELEPQWATVVAVGPGPLLLPPSIITQCGSQLPELVARIYLWLFVATVWGTLCTLSSPPTAPCPTHSVATSHSRFALFLGAGLLLLLQQQQHCSPATDLWHTNRPNNNWPHLVSFPAATAWQLAQNVARISLGSAQFPLFLSFFLACKSFCGNSSFFCSILRCEMRDRQKMKRERE